MESFGEFFRISTIEEVRTRLRKRLSKARKRKENGDEVTYKIISLQSSHIYFSFFYSNDEIKIDWDLSLLFTSLCEIKFDGKIRAIEMFMDSNLICKVNLIEKILFQRTIVLFKDCGINIE